jgi:hypothetical protein
MTSLVCRGFSFGHAGTKCGSMICCLCFRILPNPDSGRPCPAGVVEGLDILPKLQRIDPSDPKAGAVVPDKIVEAEIVQLPAGKKAEDYKPNKVK